MRGSDERSERGRNGGGRSARDDAAGRMVERSEEKEGWEKDASPRSADSNSIALPRESEVGEGER